MRGAGKQNLIMFVLALGVVAFLGAIIVGVRYVASWNVTGSALSGISEFSGRLNVATRTAVEAFGGRHEPLLLEEENARLRTQLSSLTDVAEENEFLRRIADLPARADRRAVVAGVFNYAVVGQQMQMVINKGSHDSVVPGSTVVTDAGVLIGIVDQVRERSATVRVLGDPSVQVTGRVGGTQIGGLVRVDQTGQLVLDLIGKDEAVSEGAPVIASGLDQVPAGLLIGTVRSVDPESTTLFQIIRLDAAHTLRPVWRTIVLIP